MSTLTSTLPATLPRLSSCGRELDLSFEAFGELESSIDLLDDVEALRERMDENGYLFLPGYLNRDEVLEARDEVARRFAQAGHLDPNFEPEELIPNPEKPTGFNPEVTKHNAPLMKVLYDGPMMEFYTRFFGGEVRHYDYTWFRANMPGRSTAPHMDVVYMGRGTHNLLTAWTPIGDIPIEVGGLMILENSHKHEKLNRNYAQKDVDKFCVNRRGEEWLQMGGGGNIRPGGWLSDKPDKLRVNLGGRWLTAQYRAGDLLTFKTYTIHAGIDNQSNRIRLSSDSRYQLASEPVDERWIGENPIAHGPNAKRGMIC
jgi:hypothetical protein